MKTMDYEKDIVYSQTIKAGKRIYYLDVKRNKRGELFLAITESKKVVTGDAADGAVTFEKHKIFIYQEDFSKLINGLSKAISYIHENQPSDYQYASPTDAFIIEDTVSEDNTPLESKLNIQIDFE